MRDTPLLAAGRFINIIKDIPKIDRQLTKINCDFPMIKRIFFSLDPDQEIGPSEKYNLDIIILLSGLSFESDDSMKDTIVPKFEALFSTKKLHLSEVVCVFEDEMNGIVTLGQALALGSFASSAASRGEVSTPTFPALSR